MPNGQDLYELEESFRQLFRRIKASWTRFEFEGVSSSQASILEKLYTDGPLKVSQLADALWITAGAVTSLSDKLIAGHFAERSRSEEDRRVVYLEITDKGREVLQTFRTHREEVVKKFFGILSEEDSRHLIRIFNQILDETDPPQS
ncbi:DNA-binding transcriptional regulator, MarR family [Paenibacillus sp. UNCCL117]|uniref:MarR family winged helix-turn-helix transcriptional regulator n=1 Tax=unclassified Paenibacillus TaxID=185978 RepID=UPI00087FABCF|nr:MULTISPECIES: MarR family transcriptional regulator [unclassified Paenibacillus]SDC18602.1 DNA-binding transcriptional regulator, MarR family [Paenibacillus sp. cl123]SFW18239.1 DNA-binding transcriptional regulator, MarR family [Paenibacillus sp. UNCCL117]